MTFAWRAVAVLLAVMAGGAPAQAAQSLPDFYGINSGSEVFNAAPAEREAHLEMMRRSGISLLRTDASWSAAEPTPPAANGGAHTYVWGGLDAMVEAMARHGLRWYPVAAYSTAWSGSEPGNLFSDPADPDDYAAFVAALAARYGRSGSFWRAHPQLPYLPTLSYEIWNEPNLAQFWSRQQDAPEHYADLYLTARAALHRVDPEADAVVGGLIDSEAEQFITRMYDHRPDARGNVDAVGFHPYQQDGGALAAIRRMRERLDRLGARRVPIEITEVGWFAGAMPEAARARTLRQLTRTLRRSTMRVTRIMPYVWLGGDYALMNHDGSAMPAGAAYAAAIATDVGPQRRRLGRALVFKR